MRIAIIVGLFALLAVTACSGERQDWRSAEAADTAEAYDQFIERHPESEHAEQARSRLAQLAEDREWQRATTTDSADAYRGFLAQHPNGKWASEARIRLENFALGDPQPAGAVPPDSTPSSGEFGIQLGAFSSDAAAQGEWEKLAARHPAQLGTLKPQVVRAASATGVVWRLQAQVGAEPSARSVCAALAQASQPCVVVLPPR